MQFAFQVKIKYIYIQKWYCCLYKNENGQKQVTLEQNNLKLI